MPKATLAHILGPDEGVALTLHDQREWDSHSECVVCSAFHPPRRRSRPIVICGYVPLRVFRGIFVSFFGAAAAQNGLASWPLGLASVTMKRGQMADRRHVKVQPFPGGFRRLWPGSPLRLPAGRDTSLVREVLSRGGARLERAAEVFNSFEHLMALAESGWLGPPRASPRLSMAESRERLCDIAARARGPEALSGCRPGDPVFVTGRVLCADLAAPRAVLWHWEPWAYTADEFFDEEDPWPLPREPRYVETAYDFLLVDELGQCSVRVCVEGAHLVAARRLVAGSRIGVLGFFDQEVSAEGTRPDPRHSPMRPVLRSGHALPLLVLGEREREPQAAAV